MTNSSKIVIIGAGLAGLTAAYRLQQNGMNVHVYEARNRVGGRVHTAKVCGNIVELGAQNIADGGIANNMFRLIEELDLNLIENKVNFNHLYFCGKKLVSIQHLLSKKKFQPESLKIQLDKIVSKSNNMHEILREILDEKDPLFKVFAIKMASYEGATLEKLSPFYSETLCYMLLGGVAHAHQGGNEENKYVNLLNIQGGNALLPEKIAQKLGRKLHLNKILTGVSKNEDHSFNLSFQDNKKISADILILAIPCSVYDDIHFDDHVIPPKKLKDIRSIRYGKNSKIIIPFSKKPSQRIGFINERMVCYFDAHCNVLTMYYYDTASDFSPDSFSKIYQKDRPMIEMGLDVVCPPFVAPVPADDQAFSSYNTPVGYSWPNDPFAKGSYSYVSAGREKMLTSIKKEKSELVKTLFAPIKNLYFAGEHTSILLDIPGTMEGACESGERIARMILTS